MGAATSSHAGAQQHSSAREESRHQSAKTVVKSRATEPPPDPESSSSSSEDDNDSDRDWSPPPQLRRSEQRRSRANQPTRQSSQDRSRHRYDGSQGRTERQAAVDAAREFTGARRQEQEDSRGQQGRYPSRHREPSTGRPVNGQSSEQDTASTVSQDFRRRAQANDIDVRAPSDRGDLRRQRGLAEYDRQTRQRAQIADDEALARRLDRGAVQDTQRQETQPLQAPQPGQWATRGQPQYPAAS